MKPWNLIGRSLRHHARLNLAVALGVMAGTAVLTGALLIGDSVRGSLRQLTLARLGSVDEALVTRHFFREELAREIAGEPQFKTHFSAALPAIALEVSLERPNPDKPDESPRAGRVSVVGGDAAFFQSFHETPPGDGEIVLNAPLAARLEANVGDEVLLRIPEISAVPRETALGKKSETVRGRRLKVARIVPATGLGQFGLRPNQTTPRNAFVSLRQLQTALDQIDGGAKSGRINAVFVTGPDASQTPTAAAHDALTQSLRPQLADYGLVTTAVTIPDSTHSYINLTSKQMLLPQAVEEAFSLPQRSGVARSGDRATTAATAGELATAGENIAGAPPPPVEKQQVLTYLANTIANGKAEIPYSTITAIDFTQNPPLGPFQSVDGTPLQGLEDDKIALLDWAAKDLGAKIGDTITIKYFEPESTHGAVRESTATFLLTAIVKLAGPAADRALTPDFPGITDKLKIGEWDPPFPYDGKRIRPQDEAYWDDHGPTPKAYVSLAAGQRLWGSRFGSLTSLRIAIDPSAGRIEQFSSELEARLRPAALGFQFQPVKAQGLAASSGTTPFDFLFLGFSFFIIAAAVMLVALLFRLGVDGRAAQIGLLFATGIGHARVKRMLTLEGLIISGVGGLAGIGLGIGYAWLMLKALGDPDWWLAAVSTPFLQLHVTARSLLIGYACGVLISYLVIRISVHRLGRVSVRQLMAGQTSDDFRPVAGPARWTSFAIGGAIAAALLLAIVAFKFEGEAQAGAFLGSGAMVLAALLSLLQVRLKTAGRGAPLLGGRGALERMAIRNGARHPGRSVLTIGLVASATFLIVAISAFRIDPSNLAPNRNSGNGGFALLAESDQPLFPDLNTLNTPAGRRDFKFSEEDAQQLSGMRVFSLRVRPGDDASCLNLYQTNSPRVLGLPAAMIQRGGFAWAGSSAVGDAERANPWTLLEVDSGETSSVPIVLDAATAQYSLHIGLGGKMEMQNEAGQTISLVVVGLLKNSIFQGDVLMSESQFRRHFPQQSGYRFFLIDAPAAFADNIARLLDRSRMLGGLGFATERTSERLTRFLAVQNTYLSTFQSLGGLGLLLGTLGLATVQLRNVFERRGEMALLRATGLRRWTLARLVMTENTCLLLGGLFVGSLAALVAILPHLFAGGAAIPWQPLGILLGIVLSVGLLAGLGAVRAVLQAPLLPALRNEN